MGETIDVVRKELFDQAIAAGIKSAKRANHAMDMNRVAVDAIGDALKLIKTGRVDHARERLDTTVKLLTRMSEKVF